MATVYGLRADDGVAAASAAALATAVANSSSSAAPTTNDASNTSTSTSNSREVELSSLVPNARPLQIITISEDRKAVRVVDENLDILLDNLHQPDIPDQLVIISVIGAFRTGKSFLLSVMLEFLKGLDPETHRLPPDFSPLLGESSSLAHRGQNFKWRAGPSPETLGIWIYSEPFVVADESGNEVALLLVDTQGLFDHQTTTELTRAIFGLTALLSSYQIVNVHGQIQDNTLQEFHHFTEIAHSALNEIKREFAGAVDPGHTSLLNGGKEAAEIAEGATDGAPFQTLEFLVRDYQHEELPDDDPAECARIMKEYLDSTLGTASGKASSQEARQRINESFHKIQCFLLPHPGLSMTKPSWNGDATAMDEHFKKMLTLYVNHVLTDGLTPKRFLTREITKESFGRVVRDWTQVFETGTLPEALTMAEAMTRTYNLHGKDEALRRYRTIMRGECTIYLAADVLAKVHAFAELEAMDHFVALARYGTESTRKEVKRELAEEIESEFVRFKEENILRLHQGLNQWAPLLTLTLVMLAIDLSSNIICDWWSDTCVRISWWLWSGYMIGFLVVAVIVYFKYKHEGKNVAIQSLLGLFSRVVEMLNETYDKAAEALNGVLGGGSGRRSSGGGQRRLVTRVSSGSVQGSPARGGGGGSIFSNSGQGYLKAKYA